jgi:membrane-associated phospholipid phosphatase
MFKSLSRSIILFIPILLLPAHVFSGENAQPRFSDLFYNFGNNLTGSFTKDYGIYHLSAIGLSYGLVQSDADWRYHSYMEDNQAIPSIGMSSVIAGGLIPLTVPFYLYFRGKSKNNDQLTYSALAMGQSVIMSLLISSAYKAVTGRPGPNLFDEADRNNNDNGEFHFGFLRRGIFEGWPSGHTMNAFAMAGALTEMYRENQTVKIFAWIYASFIGMGVSTNIHWLSDCAAGALIGYSIGKTVGSSFRRLYDGKSAESSGGFYFSPNGAGYMIRF